MIPNWPAPACVRARCSTRLGGVSQAPYDSFNLGRHVGDAEHSALANRALFEQGMGAKPVFLNQVHRWAVCELQTPQADIATDITADASLTMASGLACTIMVADCVPVLICSRDGLLVGAAHAGWRGLLGEAGHGVIEAWLGHARGRLGPSADWMAWLGPCIGPTAFEVGDEVRSAFVSQSDQAEAAFRPHKPGKWLADLAGLVRMRLQAQGVTAIYGNDGGSAWCTVNNPSRFFSHRRDRVTGRFAAAIWRTRA